MQVSSTAAFSRRLARTAARRAAAAKSALFRNAGTAVQSAERGAPPRPVRACFPRGAAPAPRARAAARAQAACRPMLRLSCFSGAAYDAADAALRNAAARGDVEGVTAALARGADVDCRSADEPDTPLFLAVLLPTTDAAAALLKAGASVHARNSHGAAAARSSRRGPGAGGRRAVWRRWGCNAPQPRDAHRQRRSCPHTRASAAAAPRRRAPGAGSRPARNRAARDCRGAVSRWALLRRSPVDGLQGKRRSCFLC